MATTPEGKTSKPAEWEQTLIADETPEAAPAAAPVELAPEIPSIQPLGGETTLQTLEPAPDVGEAQPLPTDGTSTLDAGAAGDGIEESFPAELRRYVRREGSTLILKEPYLALAQRVQIESRVAGRGTKLVERRWLPSKREPVHEIEKSVDALEVKPRYQPKGVSWLHRSSAETRRALRGLERVPANIVAKRVVYETEGGLVVEVTYRELGQVLKKFFTIPAVGSRAKSLQELKSGSYATATAVSDDLIDAVARPRGRGHSATPPGKVNTWPIRNKHRVEILGLPRKTLRGLAALGIHSTDQLRVRSPVAVGRHLAIGADEAQAWQYACEFLLLPKMGPAHAKALAEAGIRGLDQLRRTTPTRLVEAIQPVLAAKKGKVPGVGRARAGAWVRAGKKLRKTKQDFPAAAA